MSTVKATYLQHPSSGTANITLNADGTVENVAGMGKVLQVVSTTKTDTFTTSSDSLTAVTGLNAVITPKSASNKILIVAKVSIGSNPAVTASAAAILRGGTAIAIGDAASSRSRGMSVATTASSGYQFDLTLTHLDSPATTSAVTYAVGVTNAEQNAQTVYVNRSADDSNNAFRWRTASSITVMEVAA